MKSFSLIELLVVISMIMILTVSIVPNFHSADSKITLERSAYKLAQSIRNTEEMAMSSLGTSASKFGSSFFPQGGYGLYFKSSANSSSYILFADCDGDGKYNETKIGAAASCSAATALNPYPNEKVEDILLDSGVKIKQNPGNQLDSVVFLPPDPEIKMQPNPASNPAVSLYSTKNPSKLIVIYVNEVGNIEIKNQ